MKIIEVVPQIDNKSSGPSHSVPRLTEAISDCGNDVTLCVLNPLPKNPKFKNTIGFDVMPGKVPKIIGSSPKMKSGLTLMAQKSDIIHTHSLWKMPNIYPGRATTGTQCKLVISPRGTLSEWSLSHHKWRKKIINFLAQKKVLLQANCLHATCNQEYKDIRRLGFKNPIAIIPNGIDLPQKNRLTINHQDNRMRLLFLSRIHPKKGVKELIEAWKIIQNRFLNWDLYIAGPLDNSYARKMQTYAKKNNVENLVFTGELTGKRKTEAYCNADIFVLPSYNENFGMVVAESLSHCTPAIVSTNAPWSDLSNKRCGWTFNLSVQNLVSVMSEAMEQPRKKLTQMGEAGFEWMREEYSWSSVGAKMDRTYRWLLGRIEKPDFIDTIENK